MLSPRGYLTIDPGMVSGDVFANVPVSCPNQMGELFDAIVENPVGLGIKSPRRFRMSHDKPIKVAPVVIELLHKLMEHLGILGQNIRSRHLSHCLI